uniref:WHY domain class transcription factor n=1 Tax=Picea sitchensis TaxID=3332 RepID=A9NLD1_PICSI|nr:unknown [Picea sitchensis]
MLRLKVLGARILGGSATRRFQPLCMPFSSSHWYSKVAKASSNDELSEVRGLSSSLDHYALTQPEFLRRQTNKIYVKHTVYKGEGALTMKPKLPDYITLNMGGVTVAKEGCMFLEFAPAVGPRQYDWSKKKIIALSVVEVGTLLSLGPDESCEFTHDPFMGKSEAGKIMKVLKVGNLQDTGGYFFNLSVTDRIADVDESFSIPITKGEFSVMQSIFNFILPYLMGWHAYMDSTKLNESGHFKSGGPSIAKRPDLEWGR